MADTKISALTAATTPLAGTEVLPIVQGGVTKKVSVADLTAGRAISALSLTTTGDITSGSSTTTTNNAISLYGPTSGSNSGCQFIILNGSTITSAIGNYSRVIGGAFNTSLAFYNGGSDFVFYSNAEQLRIAGTGDITFKTGNLIQGAAAKGINFTANSAAAGKTSQLLNWYEEGTFTPTITGATTAGTGTYTNQIGRYTRIGRAVHFTIYVTWTAHTGTGTILVGDLPFASNSTAGQYYQYAAASDSLTYGANATLQLLLFSNQTKMTCYAQSNGAALAGVNIDTQADLIVTGTYFV